MGPMGVWGRLRRPQGPMTPIGTHFKMGNPIFKWEIPFNNGILHLKSIISDQSPSILHLSGIPDPFQIHLFSIFPRARNSTK